MYNWNIKNVNSKSVYMEQFSDCRQYWLRVIFLVWVCLILFGFFSFPDLSFQAATRIMSNPVYDALKVMKDIAQNFPVRARYDT